MTYIVDPAVVHAVIKAKLNGSVVGWAACIGSRSTFPSTSSGGDARTNADGLSLPFQENMLTQTGSVGKFFTAIGAIRLLDDWPMQFPNLDSNIGGTPPGVAPSSPSFLPADWNPTPSVRAITFRQLLSHTSGLPYGKGLSFQNMQKLVETANVTPTPGSANYSNYGFSLFRVLLPLVDGMQDDPGSKDVQTRAMDYAVRYLEIVKRYAWRSAGVTEATTAAPTSGMHTLSYAWPVTSAGTDYATWKDSDGNSLELLAGPGGWWVSIDDAAKLLLQLNADGGTVLSPEQWRHMRGIYTPLRPGFDGLGLGIDLLHDPLDENRTWIEKNGEFEGNMATVAFFGSPTDAIPIQDGPWFGALFTNSNISYGPDMQDQWHYCDKCGALFYSGQGLGTCPKDGKGHEGVGTDYALTSGAQPAGEPGWKWCSQCQQLCYEPTGSTPSVCANGKGRHTCPDGPYTLDESGQPTESRQAGWAKCCKCGVLYFAPNGPGVCQVNPAGHDPTGSGSYVLQGAIGPDAVLLEAFKAAVRPG